MKIIRSSALEILESKLLGAFISGFHLGDTWSLRMTVDHETYWLVAQNIISDDEMRLNSWFGSEYALYHTTVDQEYVAKCAIVAANMRRRVTEVKLDDVYNLTVEFEKGGKLIIPVNETMVDWQWCLNKTGHNPYEDYIVGCFGEGGIRQKP